MTIWLVLTESQFVCKDYIEYSSVQIISSIIGATSFYFDLHSSVVNIRRFLWWNVAELSFSTTFSSVDSFSLQTVLSARSCKWVMWLLDALPQHIHTKEQYANWDLIKDLIKILLRPRLINLQILVSAFNFMVVFSDCFKYTKLISDENQL